MAVKLKLKATVVRSLGDTAFSDTISSESYQKTVASEQPTPTDDIVMPDVGDVVGGQYRLVSRLGEGMFGSVFVAERTDVTEHRVALKLINRAVYGDRDNERELVMLAAATHPHIVELKDHGITSDYIWLTMALYEGETLSERLERGCLDLEEAHRIFLPISQGVAALHVRGLRHQDIKPENIYLADFAGHLHPVLLDLGVAVEAESDFVAGTALFGAPEQLAALGGIGEEGRLSERMDTYCLASTLLYALVGDEHFPGAKAKTPFEIVRAFDEREEAPLADEALPELTGKPRQHLAEAFARWLTKDPEKRPDTSEFAKQLEVLLDKRRGEELAEQTRITRQKRTLRRVQLALVGTALAAGAGGLYLFVNRRNIELANELAKARQEGAESFDKLDTCVAAHAMSQRKARICEQTRRQDGTQYSETISALESKQAEATNALTLAKGSLKSCEEDAEQAATVCAEEQETMTAKLEEATSSFEDKERTLTEERDSAREELSLVQSRIQSLEAEAQSCQQELASCQAHPSELYGSPPGPPKPAPGKTPAPAPPSPAPTDPYGE